MNKLNAQGFKAMLESGANHLTNRYREIDQLNVFPVPDGDTGTNMSLTFSAGVKDALANRADHLGEVSKTFSRGLLMGARGNSGVILSQIFRGFTNSVVDKTELNALDIALAFDEGKRVAYKAVMRPVEGTILTVLRMAAEATLTHANDHEMNVIEVMDYFLNQANIALEKTPEMLPVLKEVGVVDSGGYGFTTIIEGFKSYLIGEPIVALAVKTGDQQAVQASFDHEEFGYCTEFIVRLDESGQRRFNEDRFKAQLEELGDSLVVVQDEDIVKVHVHTLTPGDALNLGQRYGEFVKLKIENMSEQHAAILVDEAKIYDEPEQQDKAVNIISVCAGDGLRDYFLSLNCDKVISGGQTMNPSTTDFVETISELKAETIIILPNNSNIVMAAKQARDLLEDRNIVVLETTSIAQGVAASIAFNPMVELDENLENMQEAVDHVISGQITYAIKDTSIDGIEITKDDYMAMMNKKIVGSIKDREEALITLVEAMVKNQEDYEIVTLIYGEDVNEDIATEMADLIEEKTDLEVELVNGQQPVYSYIVGVE